MRILKSAYVCWAVPLFNWGIYAILVQFAVIGITVGALAFAAPSIVSVSIPSFGSYLFGICAILVGLTQAAGFFGVFKEKPAIFRKYTWVNSGLVALTFLIALIWIIVSITNHSDAVDSCSKQFSEQTSGNSSTTVQGFNANDQTGETICKVWTWVQVGVMAFLWVVVGLTELYFILKSRTYSLDQREAHKQYDTVFNAAEGEIIALRESGMYDRNSFLARNSSDLPAPPGVGVGHERSFSKSSGLRNEVRFPDGGDEQGDGSSAVGAGGKEGRPKNHRTASEATMGSQAGLLAAGSGHRPYPSTSTQRSAESEMYGSSLAGMKASTSQRQLAVEDGGGVGWARGSGDMDRKDESGFRSY
ncbi:hypothetical protein BT69DRAFT_1346211 [Atractiella rhizophila]|nr:hypothetical protein BT69DRAFT_1346211 [Atractiella rhizophila]